MREYTYVGAAVTSDTVDNGTADSAPSRRTCKRRGVFKMLTRPQCGRMRSKPGNTLSLTAAAKVRCDVGTTVKGV